MTIDNEIHVSEKREYITPPIITDGLVNKEIYEGTNITFECKFLTAIAVKPVIWYRTLKNGTEIEGWHFTDVMLLHVIRFNI
jgi:hypothetical protein